MDMEKNVEIETDMRWVQIEMDKDKTTGIVMDMVIDEHQKRCHRISFALTVTPIISPSSLTITQAPSASSEGFPQWTGGLSS